MPARPAAWVLLACLAAPAAPQLPPPPAEPASSGVPHAAPAAPLDFASALTLRRPSPEELEAAELLAEAAGAAAGAGALAAAGPTVAAGAGPRHGDDGTAGDFAVAVDLPLLSGRGHRAALAAAVAAGEPPLRRGAAAVAAADLAAAFGDAWLARQAVAVREEDLATVEAWLAAALQRAEAGADPPYEPVLVAGERDRALVELVAARRAAELAWAELVARAAVGATPRPLSLAGMPEAPAAGAAAAAGIEARRRLELALARARSAAAESRWGVASEVASEGDERFAHLGVSYRLPLRREREALAAGLAAAEARAEQAAVGALARLEARLAAARQALDGPQPGLGVEHHAQAHRALAARLAEGRERASQILPLRRQLLEARLAGLAAEAVRRVAAAELHLLLGGPTDVR